MHRPTRDIDFLGFGPADCEVIERVISEIIATPVDEDALQFDPSTIKAESIREDAFYEGIRVKLTAKLDSIRIPMQIDIGFGDAITPASETKSISSLIPELPGPEINAYPVYSVIAEKLEAMVTLGDQNSRMKDFFDIHYLVTNETLDAQLLKDAIIATFERRKTDLPQTGPQSLSEEFAGLKQTQWQAFLGRNKLDRVNSDFSAILQSIRERLPIDWKSLPR